MTVDVVGCPEVDGRCGAGGLSRPLDAPDLPRARPLLLPPRPLRGLLAAALASASAFLRASRFNSSSKMNKN